MSCAGTALRIVSDNAADRATITAANTASGLGVEWLKTDFKSQVCRITAVPAQIVLTWPSPENLASVVIPASNLSSESEIRVRVYQQSDGSTLLHDSGWLNAAPGPIMAFWDFSQTLNVNGFLAGTTAVQVWFPGIAGRRVEVDLHDPQRTFLDIARIVVGAYFEPKMQATYGSGYGMEDQTSSTRSAAGDMRIKRGPKVENLIIDMADIDESDRHRFANMLKAGVGKHHFISLFPEETDISLKQDMSLYGLLQNLNPLIFWGPMSHSTQFQLVGW